MLSLKSIPNYLTYLRIFVIPIIIATFYFEKDALIKKIGAILFLFACLTDFLDGWLARKLNCTSKLGELLDPIADKILVSTMLLMLVKYRDVDIVPCLLILAREVAITNIRNKLSSIEVNLKVSNIAKIKTFIQMSSLFLFLLGGSGYSLTYIDTIALILLWIAAILTVYTGYLYWTQHIKQYIS
ncbi:MAG: CDP-diacylglycerol--glycerol-3-phosphate 3-phosphatidyltransferase [Rickettsiales bacterium]